MAWRVAKSLLKFREQVNLMSPHRNRSSDGTIGDAKHASRNSDHNPWVRDGKTGIVTALDLTHDVRNGVDTWALAEFLRQRRDPRIKYVISNKRIFSSATNPWVWRNYTGSNPHSSHMHLSVHSTKNHYDHEGAWQLQIGQVPKDPDDTTSRPILKIGSRGPDVAIVQGLLGLKADQIFGPITDEKVKDFQTKARLKADGVVGPLTWGALDRIEQRRDGEGIGDALED